MRSADLLFTFASLAAAQGQIDGYTITGVWHHGWSKEMNVDEDTSMQRSWSSGPITDPNSRYLPCNNPGAAQYESSIVRGGEDITAHFSAPPWTENPGFIAVWMTECGGRTACATFKPSRAKWWKIAQSGLLSGTVEHGQWAPSAIAEANNSFTSTIPAGLPDGGYLIRHEVVLLGSKQTAARFYPFCGQLAYLSGNYSKSGVAPDNVRAAFPGLYKKNDPALSIDSVSGEGTAFKIPGPEPWKPGDTPTDTTASSRLRRTSYTELKHRVDENAHILRVYR